MSPGSETLNHLSRVVEQTLGLFFPQERHKDLERAMGYAAKELSFSGTAECIEWILCKAGESEKKEVLAKYLTIGETYFFRDKKVFNALNNELIPDMIEEKKNNGPNTIKIWSAACSSGEEPYTIAMSLAQLTPLLEGFHTSILASDINRDSIAKARTARYSEWSFRDVPDHIRKTYFIKKDRFYDLSPQIKNKVTFERINLVYDNLAGLSHMLTPMDIIFCRNVLIYFDQEKRDKIISKLASCLSKGGTFITSPSELGLVNHKQLKSRRLKCGTSVFQKGSVQTKPISSLSVKQFKKPLNGLSSPQTVVPRPKPVISPVSRSPLCKKYISEFDKGNYTTIINELTSIINNKQKCGDLTEVEVLTLLAESSANSGDHEQALRWGKKIIEKDKITPDNYFFLASIYIELNMTAEACDSLKKCIFLDPECVMAYFTLANISPPQTAKKHYKIATAILESIEATQIIPFSEGMSAAHLLELVNTMAEAKNST